MINYLDNVQRWQVFPSNALRSQGWPWNSDPPASFLHFPWLGLQVWLSVGVQPWGLHAHKVSILPLSYMPVYVSAWSRCPPASALWQSAGSTPEAKRATERWLMAVCRADSTTDRKNPQPHSLTPTLPGKPQPACKVVLTTDQPDTFLQVSLPLQRRRPFSNFQHLRVLPLPYRFGSSSLIGCIFHLICILTLSHSEPAGTLWIPACLRLHEFQKDVFWGFVLLFSVGFSFLGWAHLTFAGCFLSIA